MSVCEFCEAIFSYSGDDQSSSGTLRPFSGSLQDANRGESACPLCDFFSTDIENFFYYLFEHKPPEEFRYVFKHKRVCGTFRTCDFLAIGVIFSIYDIPEAQRTDKFYLYDSVADPYWGKDFNDMRVDSGHTVHVLRYRTFTTDESERLAKGISGRLLSKDLSSESALIRMVTLAGRHDSTCDCLSVNSNNLSYPELPTRILDIGSAAEHDTIRLVEGHDRCGHYAALSHCWGLTRFVTTAQNLPDRLHKISIPEMPRTFQDAILVTRRIGIRYLWIDSLCILQEDPTNSEAENRAAKVDFKIESSMMSEYYGNSYITIAADRSSSDSDGFLRRREVVRSPVWYEGDAEEFQCEIMGKLSRLYLRRVAFPPDPIGPYKDDPVALEPLQTRSWTLQERLLSNRVLHFGSEQNYLEDHENRRIKFEDGSVSTYSSFWETLYSKNAQSPFLQWYNVIEQYKTRKITNSSDTFPALSGLAWKITTLSRDQYCSGIWRSDLARGILWEPVGINLSSRSLPKRQSSTTSCKAPSWSWASPPFTITFSMKSVVLLEYRSREHTSYICVTLLNYQAGKSVFGRFGEHKNGYIDINAPIAPAQCFGKYRSWEYSYGHHPLQIYIGEFSYRVIVHVDECESLTHDRPEALLQDIYCVFIVCGSDSSEELEDSSCGLVLKKVDFANDREVYRRIGIFRVDNRHESELNNLIDETYGLYKKGEVLETHKKAIRII